ncbi:MAG: hypothetical protein H0T62_04240 [Parachlamydiaceae bacterium]|nr:hypothetical protein [Parachlamydiaceae bacterium]
MENAVSTKPYVTDHFFVFYDAGETNALIPVLKKFDTEGMNFKVLVMGTAETIVKPEMFLEQRLVLRDFNIITIVDHTNWQREQKLDLQDVLKICNQITARTITIGTASRVQRQVLKHFNGIRIAFCDNFDYDVSNESYRTVKKTQEKAQIVLCPSENLVRLLTESSVFDKTRKYKIAGKPSLDQWAKELENVNKSAILEKLKFDSTQGPVVTFVGGYGQGYEIINPFFNEAAAFLRENGYQVLIQPHPKVAPQAVKTTEALAISEYVIGFNSSVVYDAAVVGKKGIYFYPESLTFDHFAIREGYLPKVHSNIQLFEVIKASRTQSAIDLYEAEKIPHNSTERIAKILNKKPEEYIENI